MAESDITKPIIAASEEVAAAAATTTEVEENETSSEAPTEQVEGEENSETSAVEEAPPPPKSTYPSEQVEAIVKEVTDDVLSGEYYQHSRLPGWNAAIVERCLVKLGELKKPYKYIVTCVILQRTDAGIHAANSCYWDNTRDGYITYQYESKSMYTIVNAFCLAV